MLTHPHKDLEAFIALALYEDIREGDHTALACIPENQVGKARLLVKDNGILAGVEMAERIFKHFQPDAVVEVYIKDGSEVKYGDVAFVVEAKERTILQCERLVLNCMQRMSGTATLTRKFVDAVAGTGCQILDTRKTTPLIRFMEKWAVAIAGGTNYRYGLFDRIMIKDNHADFCGGHQAAIQRVKQYLADNKLDLPITVEVRNTEEINIVIAEGGIDRIMLDNFTPDQIKGALTIIGEQFETEASGGITLDTIRSYAETGVDFISVGALTHSYKSLDLSLKSVE